MRLLNLPLPIFAAALAQFDPPQVSGPAWVNSFLIALFVLGYFLNLMGKFPFASGERREASFREDDRRRLGDIHEIVTAEDTARPRWPRVWAPLAETVRIAALVEELAGLREDWRDERESWKTERARMELRITGLEDTVRRQEHALRHGAGGSA